MQLNDRETAVVLAALRYTQETLDGGIVTINSDDMKFLREIADPLPTSEEIDPLCEKINLSSESTLHFSREERDLLITALHTWQSSKDYDGEEEVGPDDADCLIEKIQRPSPVLVVIEGGCCTDVLGVDEYEVLDWDEVKECAGSPDDLPDLSPEALALLSEDERADLEKARQALGGSHAED